MPDAGELCRGLRTPAEGRRSPPDQSTNGICPASSNFTNADKCINVAPARSRQDQLPDQGLSPGWREQVSDHDDRDDQPGEG
jgi:hypothetical protein